jgi:hypothetical protein
MKSILVNYTGGYCGNFLSVLIGESLNVDHKWTTNSFKNSYFFESKEIDTKYIKLFSKLFEIRRGILKKEDLAYIAKNGLDDYYTHVLHLYNILDDDDEEVFIENLKSHYADLMGQQKSEYFITCLHYGYQYKNLSLHDVFPDSTILHVITSSKRYARYFHLLFHFKTKDNETDKILQTNTLRPEQLLHDFIKPVPPRIFDDRSIAVDMGKLIFEKDYTHLSEIEEQLSKAIHKTVKLDRKKFVEYADRNVDIVKSILGEDFMSQSEEEQVAKSLNYIHREIKVNQ